MPKIFLSYDQQIEKLKNEKNLQIDDEAYAKQILRQTSYYSLIGGYKEFIKELKALIDKYLKKHDSITERELYEKMGFPKNWRKITRYRK